MTETSKKQGNYFNRFLKKPKLLVAIFALISLYILGSLAVKLYYELHPGNYNQLKNDPIISIVFDDAELLSRQNQKRGFYGIDHPYNPPNIKLWYGTNNSIKEVESFYREEFEKAGWKFNAKSEYDSPISSNISYLSFLKNGGCGEKNGICGNLTFLKQDVDLVERYNNEFVKVDKKGYSNIYQIKITASQK